MSAEKTLIEEKVIVLDFGGHHSQTVARRIRDTHVYCEILPYDVEISRLCSPDVAGIVLAGDTANPDPSWKPSSLPAGIPIIEVGNAMPEDAKLKKFLFTDCQCEGNWKMDRFAESLIKEIRAKVGNKKVLSALSGGVDSSVASVLVHKAIGDQLTCIFVDHGLLRKNEARDVMHFYKESLGLKIIMVDASERFLSKLAGVTEPERKRKIIGEEFIRVFEEEARKIGAVDYLVQGTIYPDVIESGSKKSAVIKSHHNVGGLPE
ncbi:MAG: hypothetical protein LBU99_06345, partial [Spirochaetaceae bacterium]|nr:hypothetical protein [Spirochaetaceae bacterium]